MTRISEVRPADEPRFRPELLVLARQAREMTQKDLAQLSGISQPTLSRIEEYGAPTAQQLTALAQALDFPPAFFHRTDSIYGFGVGELFHRRRKQIPVKVLDSVHAEVNIRRMTVDRLLKSINIPDVNLPTVDRDDPQWTPESAARALRARWLLPSGPVQSVTDLLAQNGIVIVPGLFKSTLVDAIGIWALQSPPMVFVNLDVTQDRLRLTLMHEVGHFILHSGWGLDLGPEIEDEANRFAGEFLAPADEIRHQLFDLSIPKLTQLKRQWRISMGALLMRARSLETISDRQYRRLWTEMGSMGYRVREPAEFDVTGEAPEELFQELLRMHRDELQYSLDELAQKLMLSPGRFREDYLGESPGPRLISGAWT